MASFAGAQEHLINKTVTLYEYELRKFGVEINAFEEHLKNMLEVCVDFQIITGLHDLDEFYLNEYQLQKRKEQVDNKLAAKKLQAEIDDLQQQIQQESTKCDILRKFINQPVVSEQNTGTKISLTEKQIQNLESKLNEITIPDNLDVDELMKKIDFLEHSKDGNSED